MVDTTGVGRPVVDLFSQSGLYPIGIIIAGGNDVIQDEIGYRVQKKGFGKYPSSPVSNRTFENSRSPKGCQNANQ